MAKFDKNTIAGKILFFVLKVLIICLILSVGSVLLYRFVPVFYTPLMIVNKIKDGTDIKHTWVDMDDISDNMKLAAVAGEDADFLKHNGFDTDAIFAAAKKNSKGKKIYGGSTISQQTAKNVFLYRHGEKTRKSYFLKALEAYYTVLIETCWSKERILEVYLNVIEMGYGIYGCEAAAEEYYGCTAKELTKRQAASIAACFPQPKRANPHNMNSKSLRHRRQINRDMRYLKSLKFD